jgi:hypothetical protein
MIKSFFIKVPINHYRANFEYSKDIDLILKKNSVVDKLTSTYHLIIAV